MKTELKRLLLRTRIGRAWWLPVLFLLVNITALKAGDYTYTTNSDNTLTITRYTGPGGEVVIPSVIDGKTVTRIGKLAFSGDPFDPPNTNLTSVTIPDSVTSIGDWAFSWNSGLTSVTLGNSVICIEESSFSSTSLTNVNIPDSVKSIGMGAFWGCIYLTSALIGTGVTNIEHSMFDFCFSLTSITVNAGNSVYSSLDGVVFDKCQATLINYPEGKSGNYAIPDGITSIGEEAFSSSYSLTGVTIPDSVTNIGAAAFMSCTNLTTVNIPDGIVSIGYAAFDWCRSLTSVTIPDSVTSIEDFAFDWCSSLASVTIPDSVASIGARAFNYCLTLTSVSIGKGVTRIRSYAFADCPSLMRVYFMGNVPSIGSDVFKYDDYATIYYLPGTTGWGWTFGERPAMPWWDGPQISANNIREDVSLNRGDTLRISVAMDAGNHLGVPVDWWILARANNSSVYFYLNNSGQWTQFDGSFSNCHPAYQGGLINLPATDVLNAAGLQSGSYTFWFAVDYPMDGILNLGGYILVDSVNIIMQ